MRTARKFTGIPCALLPAAAAHRDACTVVRDGPRNLAARPFDYRNPFPLVTAESVNKATVNGSNTLVRQWPVEDRGGDFEYYSNGHAALGLPGGPDCALVDHHGALRAFTGAWAFGLGARASAPDMRVRRLAGGRWPEVLGSVGDGQEALEVSYCAGTIAGAPSCEYPVWSRDQKGPHQWVGGLHPSGRNVFIGVRMESRAGASLRLRLGYSQQPALCSGAFYCGVHAPPWDSIRLESAGPNRWRLTGTRPDGVFTLGVLNAGPGAAVSAAALPLRHLPMPLPSAPRRRAAKTIEVRLPRSTRTRRVEWIIPMFPLKRALDAPLMKAAYADLRRTGMSAWRARRAEGMRLEIPEAKVDNAFAQALNHLDMCTVALGRSEFPTPGPSGGHHVFYERDGIDMIHAYDVVGDHRRAERMIDHYRLMNVGQENCGMVLWLLEKHWALTGNKAWLAGIMPDAERRMEWLQRSWRSEHSANGGLLAGTGICDNEMALGHFVSYHLYALSGARAAVRLARAAGASDLAGAWEDFVAEFEKAVMRALADTIARTGGVITPTFEGFDAKPISFKDAMLKPPRMVRHSGAYGKTGGCDWHNIGAAFPTGVLSVNHPWIGSSLARWRHAYVEGVFPYPLDRRYDWLHNYNTMNISGTFLRRGEWAEALRDLYGILLHTTAAHASAEVVDSSARRDFNCTPHNWFSGKLVRHIRDLLVYEGEDRRLHLLGGLSPAWMKPGGRIRIDRAPTELGIAGFTATMRGDGMDLTLDCRPRNNCRGLALHLPPFVGNAVVRADGRTVKRTGGVWPAAAETRRMEVRWPRCELPDISFERVVESYVEDYRKRSRAQESSTVRNPGNPRD